MSIQEGVAVAVTHDLNTEDVVVQVFNSPGNKIFADVKVVDENTVSIVTDVSYGDEPLKVRIARADYSAEIF